MEMFSITPITFIIDFDDEYCEYHLKQFLSFFNKNDPRKGTKRNNNLNFVNKFVPYMAWQNSDIKKKLTYYLVQLIIQATILNQVIYGF
jgi:hypothetical protein